MGELGGGQEQSAGARIFPFCREWVLKSSILIAMAVYTYLRLIVDHHGTAQLQALRQKEVDFCVSLLRERVRTTQYGDGTRTEYPDGFYAVTWARHVVLE